MLYEKFGEFDSAAEINKTAKGLKDEGDLESLKLLAKENGLDREDAEDYAEGRLDELTTDLLAAEGKLAVEMEDLKPEGLMKDWCTYIRVELAVQNGMQLAVRKKGKSLKGCIAHLLKWSFAHQRDIDKDIVKAAGVTAGRVTMGEPSMEDAKRLIREYYLGGKEN